MTLIVRYPDKSINKYKKKFLISVLCKKAAYLVSSLLFIYEILTYLDTVVVVGEYKPNVTAETNPFTNDCLVCTV